MEVLCSPTFRRLPSAGRSIRAARVRDAATASASAMMSRATRLTSDPAISARVPPVSALVGLKAMPPSNFTQISWRMRVVIGARNPAAMRASAIRRLCPTRRSVGLADCNPLPSMLDHAWLDHRGSKSRSRRRLRGRWRPRSRLPDPRSRCRPRTPRRPWKYHQGSPFWVLTTTVSGPITGQTRREGREGVRLHPQEHDVRRRTFSRQDSRHCWMHVEITSALVTRTPRRCIASRCGPRANSVTS